MTAHPNTRKRHQKVRDRYRELDAKRNSKGTRIYSHQHIIDLLMDEFDYSEPSIYRILAQPDETEKHDNEKNR